LIQHLAVPQLASDFVQTAPKARDMTARGKREARRPWYRNKNLIGALKGPNYFGRSGLGRFLVCYGYVQSPNKFLLKQDYCRR
jgi:hypothetical protein